MQDAIARKPWWQIGFNIGQYTLSLSAAALVLQLLGGYTALHTGGFHAFDLLVVVGGAAGYFVVNLLLVTRATTLYMGTPFSHGLRSDLMFGLSVSAVLLCLAPVVVTVLQFSPILYPLLLVPLVGVYFSGRQTVRTVTAEHLARHDSLTELPNRRWFLESVGQALKNQSLSAGGLLLVDLNGFKEVNDTLGHHHGDLVLQEVGPRLRGGVPRARISSPASAATNSPCSCPAPTSTPPRPPCSASRTPCTDPSRSTGSASSSTPASVWPGIPITAATSTRCSSAPTSRCTAPRRATTRS